MARDVIMPALGMAQESGVLIRWLVPEGGSVSEGDPLMEVETDKAVVEVPATASGTLAAVAYGEGAEVAVGTVLAVLLAPGESAVSDAKAVTPPSTPASGTADEVPGTSSVGDVAADSGAVRDAVARSVSSRSSCPQNVTVGSRTVVLASPKAKRLARERGLDLSQMVGTGPEGAVRSIDLPSGVTGFSVGGILGPGTGAARTAAWLRSTVDAAGLTDFVDRVGRSSTEAAAAKVSVADVLTRVIAAGLNRDPLFASSGFNVYLSVHDEEGRSEHVMLHGSQLASMSGVAAARVQALNVTAGSSYEHPPRSAGAQLRVEVIDRSREAFERSPMTLEGGAAIRLTLGPDIGASVRSGEPTRHRAATLQLDYDTAVLDDARAAALITYVSRVVGDPFALVVQG